MTCNSSVRFSRCWHRRLKTPREAIQDLGEAALEYKLDGARVQVHRSGDEVRVYSRQLNDVTGAVPEIVEAVRALPVKELILDGEVLSLKPDGRPEPFQVTMRRFGRKLDVDRLRAEQPMHPFWFDLLYLDGGSLLDETQSRRFSTLRNLAGDELRRPEHGGSRRRGGLRVSPRRTGAWARRHHGEIA